MKIDQPTSMPVATVSSPKRKRKVNAKNIADVTPASANESNSLRALMSQWIAKAGISQRELGSIEQSPLKRLARHQQINAQRKLFNLEKVFSLAMDYCLSGNGDGNIDADWFFSFVDLAENVNSAAMQDLWAKIFAVEMSKPGSFSLRTLRTLKSMTQHDAKVIRLASSLACVKRGDAYPKIIQGFQTPPTLLGFFGGPNLKQLNLAEFGLSYPSLLALMDMGIIFSSEIESAENLPDKRTQWRLGNDTFHLSPLGKGQTLQYYKFTATGAELFRLFQSDANVRYLEGLKTLLKQGYELT
ncbi:TIGR03899 family protein [Aestuariibacter sp. AA17]|uniref:TIGR03899 family protein n=1 Tax=Fluctibacter corallii TaxID=2984329 RepID=A0ABT3ADA0_9ALTE|nr:TIGR03899 family protein [Aestuariibacter sp. AA17]MCV2886634.1 TIGR03899 family protein [Aestuariibacter sp. AA17]